MVPDVRFELTTYRLQGGCSTPELIRRTVEAGLVAQGRALGNVESVT